MTGTISKSIKKNADEASEGGSKNNRAAQEYAGTTGEVSESISFEATKSSALWALKLLKPGPDAVTL
jgi:hypothetical protein